MYLKTFLAFILITLFCISFYYEVLDTESVKNTTIKPLLILHWSKAYERYIFDNTDLQNCLSNCEVTTSKKLALKVLKNYSY